MSAAEATTSADVVVVGLGAAGIAAAISAHDSGASVLVLEKTSPEQAGGNSRVSGQVWFSPVDAAAAERHFRAMAAPYGAPDDLVGAWAAETAHNSEWLLERAKEAGSRAPLDDGDPYVGDRTDFVRMSMRDLRGVGAGGDAPEHEYWEIEGNECGTEYVTIGGSLGFSRLWLLLRACLDVRGIPVLFDTAAQRLLRRPDGAVCGVQARTADGGDVPVIARRAVVLGSGGFAANREMGRNYLRLPKPTPWGSPACTGDGIRMAQQVGADLTHPSNYMAVPGIEIPGRGVGLEASPRDNRFISVGADGRRFMNDSLGSRHGKARIRGELDMFPGHPMWTIFDEDGRLAGPLVVPRQYCAFGWLTQIERYEWSLDNLAEIERGWITRADSLPELADQLGIDPCGLEHEVARYNSWVTDGVDDPIFGRPASTMRPITRPPFYGYEWGQLLITTLGGIRKDGRARALDPFGEPIHGLYCAGDVASSYSWCLSGGMGLGDALAFGRIAGREAAGLPNDS